MDKETLTLDRQLCIYIRGEITLTGNSRFPVNLLLVLDGRKKIHCMHVMRYSTLNIHTE